MVRAAALFHRLASVALPPRCPSCGAVTGEDHRFCVECWATMIFLGPPWCAGCGDPFDHDRGEGAVCGPCLARPPVHHGVRAAVAYGDVARRTVLKLKYGGRTAYADTVARLMARLVPEGADLLVPVPLHRWRLWSRGYNQAALIADALGRLHRLPVDREGLVRYRHTPSLKGRNGRERARTVQAVFRVDGDAARRFAGKSIVLVDDVHTSGATSDACARTLLAAGASRVVVLCWARVGRRDDD